MKTLRPLPPEIRPVSGRMRSPRPPFCQKECRRRETLRRANVQSSIKSRKNFCRLKKFFVNPFNNPNARSKAAPLEKRPQFVAFLRLNPERVNLRDFLIGEAFNNRAKREKRRLACKAGVPAGCLSNHGKKFCLFQNFFREPPFQFITISFSFSYFCMARRCSCSVSPMPAASSASFFAVKMTSGG